MLFSFEIVGESNCWERNYFRKRPFTLPWQSVMKR